MNQQEADVLINAIRQMVAHGGVPDGTGAAQKKPGPIPPFYFEVFPGPGWMCRTFGCRWVFKRERSGEWIVARCSRCRTCGEMWRSDR